jgi:beta-galactosidase GanA
LHDTIVGWLLDTASVLPALTTPDGVEAVERWKNGHRLLYLLNHANETHSLILPRPAKDLLSGRMMEQQVTLEPKGVRILHEVMVRDAISK